MHIDDYQNWAEGLMNGVYYSDKAPLVAALGLCGEAGEVANDVKKFVYGRFDAQELRERVLAELGDCMWYLTAVATSLDIDLSEVLTHNMAKLEKRFEEKHPNFKDSERATCSTQNPEKSDLTSDPLPR